MNNNFDNLQINKNEEAYDLDTRKELGDFDKVNPNVYKKDSWIKSGIKKGVATLSVVGGLTAMAGSVEAQAPVNPDAGVPPTEEVHNPEAHQYTIGWGSHYKGYYEAGNYSHIFQYINEFKNSPVAIEYAINRLKGEGLDDESVVDAASLEIHLAKKIHEKREKILQSTLESVLNEKDIYKRRIGRDNLLSYLNVHNIDEDEVEEFMDLGIIKKPLNEGGMRLHFKKGVWEIIGE